MPTDTFSTTDGNDGSGFYQDTAWPPNGGTWTDYTGGSIYASKVRNGVGLFTQDLAFVRFDTSSIPGDATIDAAVLKLYIVSVEDNETYSLVADYYDFGGEPTVAGDWIETATPSIFTAVDLGSLTPAAVNDFTLTDLTGVMRSGDTNGQGNMGITGVRLTLSAGTPAHPAGNWAEIADNEHAQQGPQLEVTYTEAPPEGASVWLLTA